MKNSWIRFNMQKVHQLKQDQEDAKQSILRMMPQINWNSYQQVKKFFLEQYLLDLESTQISYLYSLLQKFPENSDIYDIIHGFTLYLKVKYSLKNYTDCILKNTTEGVMYLRIDDTGLLTMPNKRSIFFSPEIWQCVLSFSPDVFQFIPKDQSIL